MFEHNGSAGFWGKDFGNFSSSPVLLAQQRVAAKPRFVLACRLNPGLWINSYSLKSILGYGLCLKRKELNHNPGF